MGVTILTLEVLGIYDSYTRGAYGFNNSHTGRAGGFNYPHTGRAGGSKKSLNRGLSASIVFAMEKKN